MKYIVLTLSLIVAGISTMANADSYRIDTLVNGSKIEIATREIGGFGVSDHHLINDLQAHGGKIHISKSVIKRAKFKDDGNVATVLTGYVLLLEDTLEYALDNNVDADDIVFHVKKDRDFYASVDGHRITRSVTQNTKNAIWDNLSKNGRGDDKSHRILLEETGRAMYTYLKNFH